MMRSCSTSLLLVATALIGLHGPAARAQSLTVPPTDLSLQLLSLVFGEAPLGLWPGAAMGSPLGAIFSAVCTMLLVVGVFWFGYNVVAVVINSAEDGSFMGRRVNTKWLVPRWIIGFGMLVPMFPAGSGAWSGAQVLMATAGKAGIALANEAARAGTTYLTNYNSATASVTADHRTLAESMYLSNLCMESLNQGLADAAASGITVLSSPVSANIIDTNTEVGRVYERGALGLYANTCGKVTVTFPDNTAGVSFSGGPFNAFDNAARLNVVRAEQQRLRASIQGALNAMDQRANVLARRVVDNFKNGGPTAITPADLDLIAQSYTQTLAASAATAAATISGPVASAVQGELANRGWIALGAWYQSISQMSSEVQKIVNGTPSIEGPKPAQTLGNFGTLYADLYAAHGRQMAGSSSAVSGDSNALLSKVFGNTGAQTTAGVATWLGGWNAGTSPVVAMKNLGDYLTAMGTAALAGITIGKVVSDAAGESVAGRVTSAIGVNAAKWFGSALDVLGPILLVVIVALFFFGVTLSVYIPMLPFLVFMGGVIGWLTVKAEALLAAPLGAFAHLEAEGEGMGSRTQYAYLFLVNVLFRPVLMVMGFFVASGAVVGLGWLLNVLFAPAMANAQFNSWTGLVQFLGFIFLYWSLALTIVTASFQLIQVIPDVALGWLGNALGVRLGTDTEERSKVLFGAAILQSRGITGALGGAGSRISRGLKRDQGRGGVDPRGGGRA